MDYSGQRFEQYQIIEKLGQGGMATVYKAYDTRLERDVAIKVVRKESIPPEQLARILKRFEREAKALAKFIHPNIVPVHDYGEYQGAPYLVMAYLPGGTLKERIGKPVPAHTSLSWVAPIARALSYAHQRGVLHRDVKPSNILITEDGSLMLSDFGIAQILEESTTQLTATGMGVGTPEYMAPEQWQGQATAASDQYALGVVLYELLTGQKPFTAETPLAVALKVMSDPLPQPSAIVAGIPEEVEKLLYKMLARSPQDRYEDMAAFCKALENQLKLETSESVKPSETVQKPTKPVGTKPSPTPVSEAETIDTLEPTPVEVPSPSSTRQAGVHDKKPDPKSPSLPTSAVWVDAAKNTTRKPDQERRTYSPKPASKKAGLVFGLSGIGLVAVLGLLLVVCVIIGLLSTTPPQPSLSSASQPLNPGKTSTPAVISTQTTEQQYTATVNAQATKNAQATATSKVKELATEQAQVTATAQAAWNSFDEFAIFSNPVYEEKSYALEHIDDDYVKTYLTGIDLKNFALEVTFTNPYDRTFNSWDYGIFFRHSGPNDQFRLYVSSDNTWSFIYNSGSPDGTIIDGGLISLNRNQGETNNLKLLAVDTTGHVFINDKFLTTIDLSARDFSGAIMIGTGFVNGHEIEGYSTKFENLRIYSSEMSGIPSITIEDNEGMNYFRVKLNDQNLDYLIGPVSANNVSNYKLTMSPNNKCFAFIVGSKVYYGVVGISSIYIAGDISDFEFIQNGGSAESDLITTSWYFDNEFIVRDDSRIYHKVFKIGTYEICGKK